jgi:hypothetical protein
MTEFHPYAEHQQLKHVRSGLRIMWASSLWGAVWATWCANETYVRSQDGSSWWMFYFIIGAIHTLMVATTAPFIPKLQKQKDDLKQKLKELAQ